MTKRFFQRAISILLIVGFSYAGFIQCIGSFALFNGLNGWVRGLSNKWINWLVFLVLWILLPVYGIALLVDVLVINSIEFWTGSNPVAHQDFDKNGEMRTSVADGDVRANFHYKDYGRILEIDLSRDGKLRKTLVLKKNEPGVFYVKEKGKLEKINVVIEKRNDTRLVTIFQGERVVNVQKYSSRQYAQILNGIGERYALQPAVSGGAL